MRDGETRTIAGTLTELRARPRRLPRRHRGHRRRSNRHIYGRGARVRQRRDVTFTYDQFQARTLDARRAATLPEHRHRERHGSRRGHRRQPPLRWTAGDLVITERSATTAAARSQSIRCQAGGCWWIASAAPLRWRRWRHWCPSATPADGGPPASDVRRSAPPNSSAVQFTATGGVAIDVSFDGAFAADERCQLPRPVAQPVPRRAGPQSPRPRAPRPRPHLSRHPQPPALGDGNQHADGSAADRPATDTPTQLPPSTVTRTVSATPTVPLPSRRRRRSRQAIAGDQWRDRRGSERPDQGRPATGRRRRRTSADLDIVFDGDVLSFTGSVPDRYFNPRIVDASGYRTPERHQPVSVNRPCRWVRHRPTPGTARSSRARSRSPRLHRSRRSWQMIDAQRCKRRVLGYRCRWSRHDSHSVAPLTVAPASRRRFDSANRRESPARRRRHREHREHEQASAAVARVSACCLTCKRYNDGARTRCGCEEKTQNLVTTSVRS